MVGNMKRKNYAKGGSTKQSKTAASPKANKYPNKGKNVNSLGSRKKMRSNNKKKYG